MRIYILQACDDVETIQVDFESTDDEVSIEDSYCTYGTGNILDSIGIQPWRNKRRAELRQLE